MLSSIYNQAWNNVFRGSGSQTAIRAERERAAAEAAAQAAALQASAPSVSDAADVDMAREAPSVSQTPVRFDMEMTWSNAGAAGSARTEIAAGQLDATAALSAALQTQDQLRFEGFAIANTGNGQPLPQPG